MRGKVSRRALPSCSYAAAPALQGRQVNNQQPFGVGMGVRLRWQGGGEGVEG